MDGQRSWIVRWQQRRKRHVKSFFPSGWNEKVSAESDVINNLRRDQAVNHDTGTSLRKTLRKHIFLEQLLEGSQVDNEFGCVASPLCQDPLNLFFPSEPFRSIRMESKFHVPHVSSPKHTVCSERRREGYRAAARHGGPAVVRHRAGAVCEGSRSHLTEMRTLAGGRGNSSDMIFVGESLVCGKLQTHPW